MKLRICCVLLHQMHAVVMLPQNTKFVSACHADQVTCLWVYCELIRQVAVAYYPFDGSPARKKILKNSDL